MVQLHEDFYDPTKKVIVCPEWVKYEQLSPHPLDIVLICLLSEKHDPQKNN